MMRATATTMKLHAPATIPASNVPLPFRSVPRLLGERALPLPSRFSPRVRCVGSAEDADAPRTHQQANDDQNDSRHETTADERDDASDDENDRDDPQKRRDGPTASGHGHGCRNHEHLLMETRSMRDVSSIPV